MRIVVLQENQEDRQEVEEVVKKSFIGAEFSDNNEHILVKRLRETDEFIEELSLIAKVKDKIVGYILYTTIKVCDDENEYEGIALAPLCVLPEYQNKGIGKELIKKSLGRAYELGYDFAVVLGHEHYYSKFGFKPSWKYDIKAPFDVPEDSYMIIELQSGVLNDISGVVKYSDTFFE